MATQDNLGPQFEDYTEEIQHPGHPFTGGRVNVQYSAGRSTVVLPIRRKKWGIPVYRYMDRSVAEEPIPKKKSAWQRFNDRWII